MAESNFIHRLLRWEPGISLSQWVYDRITNNWEKLAAIFVGGGGMTYLAFLTDWVKSYGPVAIGAVGIGSAIILGIGISFAQSLRAKMRVLHAEAEAINKWKDRVSNINPLASEFNRQRINLSDLKHPIRPTITGKRFIDCELVGPGNLHGMGTLFSRVVFDNCDLVVVRDNVEISNVLALEKCELIGGSILNCTLFILARDIPTFQKMGAHFITYLGDPQKPSPQAAD